MNAPGRATQAPWPDLVWSALLLAVGSLTLAVPWDHWSPVLLLGLASVVPLLLLRLAAALGAGRWAATAVLVLLLVLGGWVMAAEAGTSLTTTVRDAVPRLLTTPQPYALRPDLLVAPVLLTALASLLVGLRAGSRRRFTPVAAASGLYVAGLLLTAGAADPRGLMAVLLVVVAVGGWVLLDGRRAGGRSRPRARARGTATVLAVAGISVAVAATVPTGDAFEPRELVDPPVLEVVASSPLPRLGAWAADPDRELLQVTGPSVPLRLVTLDRYDGSAWSGSTRYLAFGTGRLDPVLPEGRQQRSFTHRVRLTGLGGHWLPSAGRPVAVSDDGVRVEPRTGTLFHTGEAAARAYEVTAHADTPLDAALPSARVPTDADLREALQEHLALPVLPRRLAQSAVEATAGAVTPYERAQAIEAWVRGAARLSTGTISGSQLWRIEALLHGARGEPGAGVGTSEQFSTAFALLARANSLPTRLVVGFRPGEPQQEGTGREGTGQGVRVVRGRDAFAWPEVYFEELGWVPFAPTPDDDTFRREPVPETLSPGGEDQPVPSPTPVTPTPAADRSAQPESSRGPAGPPPPVLLVPMLPLAVLLALAALRTMRSRSHLARGAPGAWREVLDALHLSGQRPPAHVTALDLGRQVDRRWGIEAAEPLARRAERAAFAPSGLQPGNGTANAERDAVPTRELVRHVRRAARAEVPRWRRWWWRLDPRVLRR